MEEIKKPRRTTYFICKDKNNIIVTYGKVNKNQEMSTGHPYLVTYTVKLDWIKELKKNNIIIL